MFFYALLDSALPRRYTIGYKRGDQADAKSGSQAVGPTNQENEADVTKQTRYEWPI
jgi:hypothetical protein